MKRTAFLSAIAMAALLTPLTAATAQTVINNNITINNGDGNGYKNNSDSGQAVYWRNDNRKLEAWLYTDRTNYRAGTGVQLRLTLTNFGNGSAHIQLPRKGEYAITITDVRTNRVIWSRDKSQSRGGSLKLNAGGTAQWTEFWDQRDARGKTVPMGAYRIDARVLDSLPVSAQVFLTERGVERPQPGNGNGGIVPPDPVTGPGNGNNGGGGGWGASAIRGSLALSKTSVRPGDVVSFTYTVVNTNRQPVTLAFGSAQLFDVWAIPATRTPAGTRTPIWRLSDGVAWAQVMQQVTLQPGAQRKFQGSWRIGNDIKPGQTLDVAASLTSVGGRGVVGATQTRIEVN
ncbi:MAG: hypothetical protein H8F28_02815 [Fibrella sp.]|nr:hypothetical protein [Armatimonadota bacterium]